VRVAARRDGDTLEIAIEDNGPGIPPELYEDAFRPFSRLDETRTRNAKGVGLGLSIARDVARAHGGDVTLSQSPLGGLRATLRVPAFADD
jgi:two-component system osmolarity sensor histidine kinase EnvZ